MFNCSKDPFNDSRLADGDRNLCADLFADSLILPEPVEFVILIGFFKRKDQTRDFLFFVKGNKVKYATGFKLRMFMLFDW